MLVVLLSEDPVALGKPLVPDSVLKLLKDMFAERSTASLFYTSDTHVLVGIVARQLNDLPEGSEVSLFLFMCLCIAAVYSHLALCHWGLFMTSSDVMFWFHSFFFFGFLCPGQNSVCMLALVRKVQHMSVMVMHCFMGGRHLKVVDGRRMDGYLLF